MVDIPVPLKSISVTALPTNVLFLLTFSLAVSPSSSKPTAPDCISAEPTLLLCNWVLPTVPSPGIPIANARPRTIIKQSSPFDGALAKVISLLLIWYAESASWITPATDTRRENDEPG